MIPANKKKVVFVEDTKGCFNVTSHALKRGYPVRTKDGKLQALSRITYQECFGDIPENFVVRHKCDNPLCINPEHLEIGTQKQNIEDRCRRGRSSGGKHGAVLTADQVKDIRKRRLSGDKLQDIALMFGVTKATISNIVNGKTWREI